MATIKAFIRTGKKDKEANIRFRLSDGRETQLFHKSELTVLPSQWDDKKESYKPRCVISTEKQIKLNISITERKNLILSIYNTTPNLTSEKLELLIMNIYTQKNIKNRMTIFFNNGVISPKTETFRSKRKELSCINACIKTL